MAVGGSLDAFIRQASAADQPRDAVHLRHQELVIRTARAGGWQALPEVRLNLPNGGTRWADVVLHRRRAPSAEYALIEIWDWFDDVGRPVREWDRRLGVLDEYAISRMARDGPLPRTGGCWFIRATQRNRRLLADHSHFFRARFPGSGRAWLATVADPAVPMPVEPAILWVSVKGDRLFPVRWPRSR